MIQEMRDFSPVLRKALLGVFAVLMSIIMLAAACATPAQAAESRGSNYDHIDVKLAATYTITIDGVPYTLKGTPVQSTLKVWIGDTEYSFANADDRSEADHSEYNLSLNGNIYSKIEWASNSSSSDAYWKPANVYFSTKIKLDSSYLNQHLSTESINYLVSIGVFEKQTNGDYWVTVDKQKYEGIQECTNGKGMRSAGNSGTPTGLDIILSAEQTGVAITKGKLAISKIVTGTAEIASFDFTLFNIEEGKYAQFDGTAYTDLAAVQDIVSVAAGDTVILTGLPAGMYRVTELQNKDGYIVTSVDGTASSGSTDATANHSKDYTIETKTDSDIPVATFTNAKIPEDEVGIALRKVSKGISDDYDYPDPEVMIYKVNDNGLKTLVWEGSLDANGDTLYLATMLEAGTYEIQEAKAAVSGYVDSVSLSAANAAGGALDIVNGMRFTINGDVDGQLIALTLENKYVEPTSVTATKVWIDNGNQDGLRAADKSVTLYLTQKTSENSSVTRVVGSEKVINSLATGTAATVTWENLPKYSGDYEIIYGVGEESFEGYTTTVSGDASGGFTVVNTHTPATVRVSVAKIWDDNNNAENKRPGEITYVLHADGEPIANKSATVDVAPDGTCTYEWGDLPKIKHGHEIAYTVEELAVENYTSTEVVTKDPHTGNVSVEITNTYDPDHTSLHVGKKWVDNDDALGARPSSVSFYLLASVDGGKSWEYVADITAPSQGNSYNITLATPAESSRKVFTLSPENNWVCHFAQLPIKDKNGNSITYKVEEAAIPNYNSANGQPGYSNVYTKIGDVDVLTGITITNTLDSDVNPVSIEVVKKWDDGNNQDGIRPDSVTVDLYERVGNADAVKIDSKVLDAAGSWSAAWSDLPSYSGGKSITYSVQESDVPAGYTSSVVGKTDEQTGVITFTITNTHTPATIDIPVVKRWLDGNHNTSDKYQHPAVTLYLTSRTDPSANFERVKDSEGKYVSVTLTEGALAGVFDEKPVYNEGKLIEYSVEEEPVVGYLTVVRGTEDSGFSVTNVRKHIEVTGSKVWADDDNSGNTRPDSIVVQLYAKVGGAEAQLVDEQEVFAAHDGSWHYTFGGLHAYEGSTPVEYYVVEVLDGDAAELYTATYDKQAVYSAEDSAELTGYDITIANKLVEEDPGDSTDGPLSKTGDDLGSKAGLLGMIAVAAAAIGVLAHSKVRVLRRR